MPGGILVSSSYSRPFLLASFSIFRYNKSNLLSFVILDGINNVRAMEIILLLGLGGKFKKGRRKM